MISLCSAGCSATHYVEQACLELTEIHFFLCLPNARIKGMQQCPEIFNCFGCKSTVILRISFLLFNHFNKTSTVRYKGCICFLSFYLYLFSFHFCLLLNHSLWVSLLALWHNQILFSFKMLPRHFGIYCFDRCV